MFVESVYHQLQAQFVAHAHPDKASAMRRYMRDQFEFLWLKTA